MALTPENFWNLTRPQLESWLSMRAFPPMHARELFRHAYRTWDDRPWQAGGLPAKLKAQADREFLQAQRPRIDGEQTDPYDHSIKLRLTLSDGSFIESVLMPEKQRLTLCLSTQVGCRQGCVFCHTARMGLKRNLETSEIVGQVLVANSWLEKNPDWLIKQRLPLSMRISNIVFMGMGEPLDNVDAVCDAIAILTDPYGLGLGLSRISVSTAGHLDGITTLYKKIPMARLALSIHSTEEQKRSRIMPINRRWSLSEVIAKLQDLTLGKASVMFQFTLIEKVNDGDDEALCLASLALRLNAKVNLIPLNNVGSSRLSAPPPERIQAFRDILHRAGVRVMVRYSKGQGIAAACGQLVIAKSQMGLDHRHPEPTTAP